MLNYQHGLFFFFWISQLLFPLLENTGQWQHQFVAVVVAQSLSRVWLFVTSWTVSHQASLSFTISQSLLKFMSTELVMPSNHLVLSCPLFLLPSIFPSIRVFSNELTLHQVAKVLELQLQSSVVGCVSWIVSPMVMSTRNFVMGSYLGIVFADVISNNKVELG